VAGPHRRESVTAGLLSALAFGAAAGILCVPRQTARVRTADAPLSFALASCAPVRADRWSPLPGVEFTGRLEIALPAAPHAAIAFVVADAMHLDLEAQSVSGSPVPVHQERLHAGPAAAIPADLWLESGSPRDLPGELVRATIDASPLAAQRLTLDLGRRAPRVLARLVGYDEAARASVCAARPRVPDAFSDTDRLTIAASMPAYFGAGWLGDELDRSQDGDIRWMGERGAVLVTSARDGDVAIALDAAPASADPADPLMLTLSVNDVFTALPLAMRAGFSTYEWLVPDKAWLAHTNEVLLTVSRTAWTPAEGGHAPRELGLAVRQLELRLTPPTPATTASGARRTGK